jgi:hypothetical protein
MTVTKDQVNRYTRKLYRFLDKFLEEGHQIKFKKMRTNVGELRTGPYLELHEGPAIITLDHRMDVISTLVHETLHRFYPFANEEWILDMEKKIMNKLTERQVKNIIKKLGQAI